MRTLAEPEPPMRDPSGRRMRTSTMNGVSDMPKRSDRWWRVLAPVCAVVAVAGCASHGSNSPSASKPSIPAAREIDLSRFMGDWYVIANIPTWPERAAFNAVETYSLREDGRIATRFRYRHGSFEAPVNTMHPIGTVRPGTGNAVWDMQFIWPFQAEYAIAELSEDGQRTLIARSDRDYAWLMARTPQITQRAYDEGMERLRVLGYDIGKVRRVPQRWPE